MTQMCSLSLISLRPKQRELSRNITQFYAQSEFDFQILVYLEPVAEKIPLNKVLRAGKPLYGIPEAEIHCFLTY